MPVLNTPVHDKTKQAENHRYGCFNKRLERKTVVVPMGYAVHTGTVIFIEIEDFGSKECRYDKSLSDASCLGCEHRGSGEKYAAFVLSNGA